MLKFYGPYSKDMSYINPVTIYPIKEPQIDEVFAYLNQPIYRCLQARNMRHTGIVVSRLL